MCSESIAVGSSSFVRRVRGELWTRARGRAISGIEDCSSQEITVCFKYDTVLSIVLMDFDAFHSRKTPLILNARKEGVWI
jgi:hypothetical protein